MQKVVDLWLFYKNICTESHFETLVMGNGEQKKVWLICIFTELMFILKPPRIELCVNTVIQKQP